jgi:Protein of unknown function (DUF3631)
MILGMAKARAAAIALCANRPDEDPGVILLNDIRVFDTMGVDRISSLALVEALHAIEDGLWLDWRGPNDDRPPRKLNQSELTRRQPTHRHKAAKSLSYTGSL